jgi:hypothetical protein
LIEKPPSAEEISIRSATDPRRPGRWSMPSRPSMMPWRQPTLPALQSMSQPEVLMIIWACPKSWGAQRIAMIIRAWLGTTWQLPGNLA